MDSSIPTLPPWPPEALPEPPPPAPPPREPAWSGLELTLIVLFTLGAMLVISLFAVLGWAIVTRASGVEILRTEQVLVALMLIGQTGGFVAGVGFAWLWLAQAHGVRFWRAIHWRKIHAETVGMAIVGGAVLMIGVQLLGHLLPMPTQVPMDRLFTPRTAWMLVIYGVGIAPFFEEFFFRGLLYPTLRATFAHGMTAEELHAWRPLTRVLGALGILAAGITATRAHILSGYQPGPGLGVIIAALVVVLVLPQWPIRGVGWILNQIARWQRAELLAIFITGLLFGLMHAAQLGWAWAAVLILVIVGIVLTMVRAYSGSLIPSWLVHCAYNGTLFAAQFVATKGFHQFPH